MSDQCIIFSPERNQWTLADGRHHMEVPEWAREIMRDEFERETRPLHDSLDLALDSKRIAERRVTELLDENTKLRELVRDAWGDGHPDRSCDGCDIREECHDDLERMRKDGVLRYSRCLFELRIEDRMRELGVEVDG